MENTSELEESEYLGICADIMDYFEPTIEGRVAKGQCAKKLMKLGYRRQAPESSELDFYKLWIEFERFLEPHTCDEIIQPIYARNTVHMWI